MQSLFFLNLLQQPLFIIIEAAFIGSFVGEFYRQNNSIKLINFISKFLASWAISSALMLVIASNFDKIKNNKMLLGGLSIFFGFIGQKKTIKYFYKMVVVIFQTLLNMKDKRTWQTLKKRP